MCGYGITPSYFSWKCDGQENKQWGWRHVNFRQTFASEFMCDLLPIVLCHLPPKGDTCWNVGMVKTQLTSSKALSPYHISPQVNEKPYLETKSGRGGRAGQWTYLAWFLVHCHPMDFSLPNYVLAITKPMLKNAFHDQIWPLLVQRFDFII